MKYFALFLTAAGLHGQATLSWDPSSPVTIKAGQTANFSVMITQTAGTNQPRVVAAQVDISCPGMAFICPTTGTTQTGRSIQCLVPASNSLRCIVYLPAGNTAIPDGTFVKFSAVAKSDLPAGNHTFLINNPTAADPSAASLTLLAPGPFVVSAVGFCDVDGDGIVAAADTDLIAIKALGGTAPAGSRTDHNGDGLTDVRDVVISARVVAGQQACP